MKREALVVAVLTDRPRIVGSDRRDAVQVVVAHDERGQDVQSRQCWNRPGNLIVLDVEFTQVRQVGQRRNRSRQEVVADVEISEVRQTLQIRNLAGEKIAGNDELGQLGQRI